MGLASEGKKELTYNLGVLAGLRQQLDEEGANPIHQVDSETASAEQIVLLKEAGRRWLDIVNRTLKQATKTRTFLDGYMAPLSKRIRRKGNLDTLRSNLVDREAEYTAMQFMLEGVAEMLEREHPA